MTTSHENTIPLQNRSSRFGALLLGASLFLVAASASFAENPWNTSHMGWSSSSSSRWASWDSTSGGTFSSHSSKPRAVSFARPAPPNAVHNSSIDPAMIKAGLIAERRAQPHSTSLCWRYVKEALVAAGGVRSYPQTTYAKDAGRELVRNYGFVQLSVRRAEQAPIGSVLVYGGTVAGHVELRTARGFVSDYCCSRPSGLPFLGAFTRLDTHKEIQTAQIGTIPATGS